jgi:hypothetical protein
MEKRSRVDTGLIDPLPTVKNAVNVQTEVVH